MAAADEVGNIEGAIGNVESDLGVGGGQQQQSGGGQNRNLSRAQFGNGEGGAEAAGGEAEGAEGAGALMDLALL